MPPQDWFVKTGGLKDGSGVDPVVEEHDQCGSPVMSDREGLLPAARSLQFLGGERAGVEIGFC